MPATNAIDARRASLFALLLPALATPLHAADPAESALYQVTYEPTWSAATHPVDFPAGAHFSGMIGGTHHDGISFWGGGELATAGVESMAETGSKTQLRQEVLAQVARGTAGAVIESNGLNSPGMRSTTFVITQEFPLATVVTMIAPSPDWFVGTAGIPLFADGHWDPSVDYLLFPWDAGTDSGTGYTSQNQNTSPQALIMPITDYPFAEDGAPVEPLGVFRFRRLGAPACAGDIDDSGDVAVNDLLSVIDAWGACDDCPQDIDMNGEVGVGDILAVLATYGSCP